MVYIEESNGVIAGEPGVGKTYNSIKMGILYARDTLQKPDYNIALVNFDNLPVNRATQCIQTKFKTEAEHIKVFDVLQVGSGTDRRKQSTKTLFDDFSPSESIDYSGSYYYLKDAVQPALKEVIENTDYLIVDALFPTIRSQIGKAVWHSNNPDRISPTESDWSNITPIEEAVYNMFVMLAYRNKIPMVVTSTLSDSYENNIKTGRVVACKDRIWKSASYTIVLSREIVRKRNVGTEQANGIDVLCIKSSVLPWSDTILPDGKRELYDILIDKGEIEI